ncbi:LysR substrate-binding domain-containing protein [Aquipuribacter hungaricus]|uniref:LysR substrate-binding domain-containing protein n=1 Tax=Aquipuribacter hungaricus TaxID=545624 RepID=A0ABV7WCS7_9MICO
MDTDALRWFQLVADGVRVTEVAETEHLTQPGLSRALARLEREVGTPLLRRQGRVLRTTEAGRAFKRHVDRVLHELDDGLAAVEQLLDPETGTVAVAFERSMGTWLVPQLVSSFRDEHPEVRVLLHHGGGADGAPQPEAAVDVELSSRRPRDPSLRWARLLTEPLVAVVGSRHRLAGAGRLPVADLAGEAFVALRGPSPFRASADALLADAGVDPAVAFEADDLATVQGFVASGLGVALVPASAVDGRCEVLGLTDPGATRDLGMVWSTERRMLPSAALFRDHVLAIARRGHLAVPFG